MGQVSLRIATLEAKRVTVLMALSRGPYKRKGDYGSLSKGNAWQSLQLHGSMLTNSQWRDGKYTWPSPGASPAEGFPPFRSASPYESSGQRLPRERPISDPLLCILVASAHADAYGSTMDVS